MRKRIIGLALAAGLVASPAVSAVVQDCAEQANPANIVEPWSTNSKTYARGEVRIAYLDTGGEPACCSGWLMVLYTAHPKDEPEYRACKLVGATAGLGFAGLDFAAIKATYDPAKGLLMTVPVSRMKEDGSGSTKSVVRVRVRLNTEAVVSVE